MSDVYMSREIVKRDGVDLNRTCTRPWSFDEDDDRRVSALRYHA